MSRFVRYRCPSPGCDATVKVRGRVSFIGHECPRARKAWTLVEFVKVPREEVAA